MKMMIALLIAALVLGIHTWDERTQIERRVPTLQEVREYKERLIARRRAVAHQAPAPSPRRGVAVEHAGDDDY